MSRSIPGTVDVETGREFLYVEILGDEGFAELIETAFGSTPDVAPPKNGGVLEEKIRIKVQNNISLLGISYRGDLEGWRRKIQTFCKEKGRLWATPSKDRLVLSDGSAAFLCDCKVEFEE